MIYVIADLHGYYKLYKKALERIHFSDADTLYVLGDVCDRGKEPMTILLDMMKRKNVIPIMGNHDRTALAMLKKEMEEADEPEDDPFGMPAAPRTDRAYMEWLREGGKTTVQDFARLSGAEKEAVIAYLERFLPYAEVSVDGREYVLVHANLGNFSPEKPLSAYREEELTDGRMDYGRRYYPDRTVVSGHTPTFMIDGGIEGRVYQENGHLAIDCGAAYGNGIGILTLGSDEIAYVGGGWESNAVVKNC